MPWLKTVVKHEAFALRRQRDRHSPVTDDGELGDRGTAAAATHDQAERMERLHQGAEALRRLKPQEMRALLLKAEGYSYAEIGEITGWSYTKVNRCLTEGRRALSVRLAGIEGGVECAAFAPLLSALVDGEASAEQLARLRPHMKTCLSCRARLKEFRAAPARVAALVPPAALVATTAATYGLRAARAVGVAAGSRPAQGGGARRAHTRGGGAGHRPEGCGRGRIGRGAGRRRHRGRPVRPPRAAPAPARGADRGGRAGQRRGPGRATARADAGGRAARGYRAAPRPHLRPHRHRRPNRLPRRPRRRTSSTRWRRRRALSRPRPPQPRPPRASSPPPAPLPRQAAEAARAANSAPEQARKNTDRRLVPLCAA